MKRIVPILILAVTVLLPAVVQAEMGLEVRPATFDERLDPGQSLDIEVKLKNATGAPLMLYPAVRDIIGMNESGTPVFTEADAPKSGGELSSYVTFRETSLTILPGETYVLVASVVLPANAAQGGLFGLIGATQTPPNPNGTAVAIGFETGTLIALRVGDAIDDAKLLEFHTDRWFKTTNDTTFITRIENLGTAIARPYGTIEVRDLFGRTVGSASFNETRRGILPGSVARWETEWKADRQLFGRFKATLAATYGEEVKGSLVATATFWVLPVKLTGIILGIAVFFFLAVYLWARSYIRRTLRASGGSDTVPKGSVSFFSVFIAIVAVAAIIIGIIFFLLA